MTYPEMTIDTASDEMINDMTCHIQPFLVSQQYYDKKLSSLACDDFLNLKICYFMPDHRDKILFISDGFLKKYGIPADLVKKQALKNIETSMYTLQDVNTMLAHMGIPIPDGLPTVPLYVLTNGSGYLGAGQILSNGLLADIAKRIGGDFYVIPSSIHEVLITPVINGMDPKT